METLFSGHNQTVVPLLANTKKASHLICQHSNRQHDGQQSIKLSTTTYQWRWNLPNETTTGHSVTAPLRPLQALELLQKDTEADCGMYPQDVPHLFNCTAHPTALTPENLWNRPANTIRELSFLDTENLD